MDEAKNTFISTFLVSLTLAKGLTQSELNLLGNYLQAVGINLCAIANFHSFYTNNNDWILIKNSTHKECYLLMN